MNLQRWISIAELEAPADAAVIPSVAFKHCEIKFHRLVPVAQAATLRSTAMLERPIVDRPAFLRFIAVAAAARYHITLDDLFGRCQRQPYREARRLAYYAARVCTDASYVTIAEAFHRHHSSVVYAVEEAESVLQSSPEGSLGRELLDFVSSLRAAATNPTIAPQCVGAEVQEAIS